MTSSKIAPHSLSVRLLHITTAVLLIYGMIRNAAATDALEEPGGILVETVFALILGALFIAKYIVVYHYNGGATRLRAEAPRWERVTSKIVHRGSYMLVAGVIGSGLVISLAATIDHAPLLRASIFAHNGFAHMLMAFIVIHIVGALWHWLVRRDGVWSAMMSFSARQTSR